MATVFRGPNTEDISYSRFGGGSFLEGPIDGWSIINSQGGSAPGRGLGNPEENRLSKDQSLQIDIRVSDSSL